KRYCEDRAYERAISGVLSIDAGWKPRAPVSCRLFRSEEMLRRPHGLPVQAPGPLPRAAFLSESSSETFSLESRATSSASSIIVQKILEDLFALFVKNRFGMELHAFHRKFFVPNSHNYVAGGGAHGYRFG